MFRAVVMNIFSKLSLKCWIKIRSVVRIAVTLKYCKKNRLRITIAPENLSQWTSSRNHLPETVDTKIYNLCSQKGRLPNFAFEEPISKEFFDNTMVAKEFIKSTLKVKHGKLENQIAENKRIDEEQKAEILK